MKLTMTKPRLCKEFKQVHIYKGYYLLEYQDGTCRTCERTYFERFEPASKTFERAMKDIDHAYSIEELERDMQDLIARHESACRREQEIEEEIKKKKQQIDKLKSEE